MIEISKELLEEILKVKVLKHKLNAKSLRYDYFENGVEYTSFSINIYELAYKCKEWALENGYVINSGATTSNDWCSTIYKVIKENPYIKELSHTWEQTEVESIFKACEWILKENK